jgi:hypothetical protein
MFAPHLSVLNNIIAIIAMSKSKAQKRKQATQVDLPKKIAKITGITTPPPDSSSNVQATSLRTQVSEEELEITVETLATLAQHPSLIKSKACKDLRVAVYDFRQACATGLNARTLCCLHLVSMVPIELD